MNKEIRVYVLDCQDISINKWYEDLTQEEWINECERQGGVYTLESFQYDFNEKIINTGIHYIRFITIEN
jgi:hypothetical protein